MLRYIGALIIYCLGWTNNFKPKEKRAVVIGYPHTSYFDSLLIILLSYVSSGYCIIKGETLFYRTIGRVLGHITVNRSKKLSQTEQICIQYKKRQTGYIYIAPEGSTDYKPFIKSGFYYIAKECNIPIICGVFNYKTKEIISGMTIYIENKTLEETVRLIRDYYTENNLISKSKFPEQAAPFKLSV